MKNIVIVTDSNSGITQEEAGKLGIVVVPMPFTIDGEEYLEDISISQKKFFELLEGGADVMTSQPSQFYLEELWTKLLVEFEHIIFIPMTSGLSGTCENAKRFAEKFGGKVLVVDNLRISVPQKVSVIEAAIMAKEGKTPEEIVDYLEKTKDKFSIYLTLATLKYLKKGGRVTPAAAAIGDLLKLKPILYTRGQSFEKFALTVSITQAKRKMIDKIKSELESEFREEYLQGKMCIMVAYSKIRDEALKFVREVQNEFHGMKVLCADPLSLSIACHTGAGALGIATCICNCMDSEFFAANFTNEHPQTL